jgi:signal transduction histidine kinase
LDQGVSSLSRPLRAVIIAVPVWGVILAVGAAAAGSFTAVQPWRWLLIPVCLGGVLLAEKFPVRIGLGQEVTLGALPCLFAVLLLPAGVGPATAGLSVLAGGRLMRRSWRDGVYNAGNMLVSSAPVALIGPVPADPQAELDFMATIQGALFIVLNLGLGVVPVAVHVGRSYWSVLKQMAGTIWPASLALGACAVSMAMLSVDSPAAAPLPLIVLPLIYRMNLAIEAQAKANDELAGVLTAQRRFLTDVSHQVATPLATIMTNLTMLSRATRGESEQEAVVDSVAEAKRMKGMLGRLRALAHSDEDVPLRRELVDLAELTADVVRAYAAQAVTSGVGLVTEVNAHPKIRADKDLLSEAVANLVDNALRYSPRGARVRLQVDRGSSGPTITVTDSGPGIDEDRLSHLFERFQRSESGSGLGLAIARRVVERHGGTIQVRSQRGEGSAFTIELPG